MEKAWKKIVSGGKEMFKGNGSGIRKPAPEPPWEPTGPDYTDNLPVEIMSTIFCYLTASDLGSRAARVCKRWWTIIGNNNPESDAFSPWRALVARDFGSLAIEDRQEATWCECYRRWSTWCFDPASCPSSVTLSESGCRANLSATGSYHAVTTLRALRPGKDMRNGMSVEHGVGIGNMAVHTTPGWHDSNDGVGWYSNGTLFDRGKELHQGQATQWDKGSVIGMFISLSLKEKNKNFIRWFKDKEEVNGRVALSKFDAKSAWFVSVLLADKQQVRLKYVGRKIPKDYKQTRKTWTTSK